MSFNIPTEKWTTEEMEEEACGRYYSSYIDVIIGRSFKNEKFLKRNTNYVFHVVMLKLENTQVSFHFSTEFNANIHQTKQST